MQPKLPQSVVVLGWDLVRMVYTWQSVIL